MCWSGASRLQSYTGIGRMFPWRGPCFQADLSRNPLSSLLHSITILFVLHKFQTHLYLDCLSSQSMGGGGESALHNRKTSLHFWLGRGALVHLKSTFGDCCTDKKHSWCEWLLLFSPERSRIPDNSPQGSLWWADSKIGHLSVPCVRSYAKKRLAAKTPDYCSQGLCDHPGWNSRRQTSGGRRGWMSNQALGLSLVTPDLEQPFSNSVPWLMGVP